MTDRELIEHLSGQVAALIAFCGAMAKHQLASNTLSRKFLEDYEQANSVLEIPNMSKSILAGLQQTDKMLRIFLDGD